MSDPHLARARERIGHVLKDRWVLEDVLGVGGMAAVYSARHRNGARAAIKLLHGPLSEDQVVRERFLREAYLANSLEHTGTVYVLDDDADPQTGPFLVMELLDGSSLLELLDAGVKFDVPAVLDIANQALDVLAAAHERGIVHRDLKPANLFLCRDGQVKVLDFGIARVLDESQARLTRTGVPLGTPAYMAPEQARGMGREADGRADIYALGATMFRLLAGRHVHVGRGAEQIALVATTRAPKLASIAPEVPAIVGAVVDRALEFEPERRYESARAMQGDVRALQKGAPPPIASKPLPDAGAVPGLPPLKPRKRTLGEATPEDIRRDAVTEIAESHRQRAREAARKPDAFKPVAEEPTDEEDENLPTLVGSPRDMILGAKPTALADALRSKAPAPRRNPVLDRPRASPQTSAAAGQDVWGAAAAQAFARIPNVPVPQRPSVPAMSAAPPTSRPIMQAPPAPRIQMNDDVDLDAPTIARGNARELLAAIGASPPSSAPSSPATSPPSSVRCPIQQTQVSFQPAQFSPPSIPPVPASARVPLPVSSAPMATHLDEPAGMSRGTVRWIALLIIVAGALIGILVAMKFR